MKKPQAWYSAKSLFHHRDLSKRNRNPAYEERITLVRARSFAEALRKGEAEARRYARVFESTDYLGFTSVFQLFASRLKDGTEIYSVMRTLKVSRERFVTRYHDDGTFHTRSAGELRKRARARK